MEGRDGEEGWVATGGLHLPCQEKGVRPLALDSKSWISSLQKINKNLNWQEFFLLLSKAMQTLNCVLRLHNFLESSQLPFVFK